jgi:hypothetical protein
MKDTPKISKSNIRSHQAMSCCAYHMVGKFGLFALLATGHLLAEMSVPGQLKQGSIWAILSTSPRLVS